MKALVCAVVLLALAPGCASRTRLPLPLPPSVLVATPEEAFLHPPDSQPPTGIPEAPTVETRTLGNGMQLVFVRRASLPLMAVRFACRASGSQDRGVRPGVDALLGRVLGQLGHLRAPTLSGTQEPEVDVLSGGVEISSSGPSSAFRTTIDAIASMAREPGYTIEVLAPLRHVLLETIAGASRGSSYMFGVHEREMIFGPSDPRAGTWWGTAPEFGRIHPEDLAARHAQLFTPSQSALVVVGDLEIESVERVVREAFEGWASAPVPMTHLGPAAFPVPHARLHAIPAGGDESILSLREHAPPRSDPDRPAFDVVTALLGGMFSARINHVLREEQGHTYGIHARVSDYRSYSALEIDLAVPGRHMHSSALMMISELGRVSRAADIDPHELETARASALAEYRNRFLTNGATATTLSGLFLRDQTLESLLARARAVETVTAEDVAGAAQRWLRVEAAPILVMGPYRNLAGNLHDIPGGGELVVWRW